MFVNFLDALRVKREELASVGVDIEETDYRSTILSSLPYALGNFASNQLAAARMFATTKTIVPDSLISLISEEYERQKTQKSRRSGKSRDDDKDEAMAVGSGKAKGKTKYPRGVCWNCGEKGHYKDKCPKPSTSKPSKDPKKEDEPKKSDSANAVESDSEGEAAFMSTLAYDTDLDESIDSGDGDWFLEAVETDSGEMDWFSEVKDDELESSVSDTDSLDSSVLSDTSDDALVAAELTDLDHRNHTYI
jgi:hypothetical protein